MKFGLKSALKKICEKELSEGKLFCFRKEAVKLFLSAKAVMVLRSHQKIVKFDGANYSTQLHFSVLMLFQSFLPTVKITRGEQENVFFLSIYNVTLLICEFVNVVK